MKKLRMCLSLALCMGLAAGSLAQPEQKDRTNQVTGFVSGFGGTFALHLPENTPAGTETNVNVTYEDIYGSKQSASFGLEAALGVTEYRLFAVLKGRYWKRDGDPYLLGGSTFDGELTWTQRAYYVGLRYYAKTSPSATTPIAPFVGLGVAHSIAKEELIGTWGTGYSTEQVALSQELTGTGFYLEGGASVFVSPTIALYLIAEYSNLSLEAPHADPPISTDGGGGVFVGGGLSFFFGAPLR